MKVHLFGATSSPGCAIYGLKKLAKEYGTKFSKEVEISTYATGVRVCGFRDTHPQLDNPQVL